MKKNYCASEQESRGVFLALLRLRRYLQFESILVQADLHALKWLLIITESSSRLTFWRLRHAEVDFEVRWLKGKDIHRAYDLSRLLTGSCTVEDDEEEILSFLLEETEADLHLEAIDLNATIDFIENDFD